MYSGKIEPLSGQDDLQLLVCGIEHETRDPVVKGVEETWYDILDDDERTKKEEVVMELNLVQEAEDEICYDFRGEYVVV